MDQSPSTSGDNGQNDFFIGRIENEESLPKTVKTSKSVDTLPEKTSSTESMPVEFELTDFEFEPLDLQKEAEIPPIETTDSTSKTSSTKSIPMCTNKELPEFFLEHNYARGLNRLKPTLRYLKKTGKAHPAYIDVAGNHADPNVRSFFSYDL